MTNQASENYSALLGRLQKLERDNRRIKAGCSCRPSRNCSTDLHGADW